MAPVVPVIIPVHNRFELTKQCLDSLVANTPKGSYQLIVVDDASDDPDTLDYIAQYQPLRLDIRSNHGAAVNRGAEIALDAPFIYFGDNDTYFAPNWLETLLRATELFPEFGIIGGDRHPWHGTPRAIEREGLTIEQADTQVGYTMLMSQELWRECGPFSEDPVGIYGNDDVALSDAVLRTGKLVGAVTPRVIYHCGVTKTDGTQALGASDFMQQIAPEGMIRR